MGDESAGFQGEDEIVRCCCIPLCECLPLRKTVKRNVQFNGGKMSAVIFNPMLFREVFRIEIPPPMIIEKTTASNP